MTLAIILAEPEHPGNIGSVCRVMANFGYSELVLIEPRCDPKAQEARNLAKHAQKILDDAKIITWNELREYSTIAATAGVLTSDYNLLRSPLTPEQGAQKLSSVKAKKGEHKGPALLFGRESTGLTNKELARADFVITISTSKRYPSMNLSHSVAVMLYELSKTKTVKRFAPIPNVEKNVLVKQFDNIIDSLPFRIEAMRLTQKKLWRTIIGRSMLTRREAQAIFGFLRATEQQQKQSPTSAKLPQSKVAKGK